MRTVPPFSTGPTKVAVFAVVSTLCALVGVACGGASKVTAPLSGSDAPSNVAALEADAAPNTALSPKGSLDASVSRSPLPLCGCALCKPVVSEDACTSDSDCAPATPCHAEACVAKAKAKPLNPGLSCTAILMCNSADANACGCLDGRCALHAKK